MLMDIDAEPYVDILGLTHGFDLDIMEQTIIDDVMAEMSVNTSFPVMMNSVDKPEIVNIVQEVQLSQPDSSAIEAADVSSLLEQFEEASQCLNPTPNVCDSDRYEITFHSGIDDSHFTDTNGNMKSNVNIMEEKLKATQKPKTAVLLPMTVPAKRGRGRAMTRGHPVAMPTNCTPRRLQRVMCQNSILKDSLAKYEEHKIQEMKESSEKSKSKLNVQKSNENDCSQNKNINENGYGSIEAKEASAVAKQSSEPVCLDHDYVKGQFSNANCDDNGQVEDYEEGELVDDDVEVDCRDKPRRDGCDNEKQVEYFDKLPSYYTALSIPRKQIRKTASHVYGRGGIAVHDFIERPISPVHDSSAMSKVPDYFSTFTNSSKYDNFVTENSYKNSNDSKTSSGYSSQSPSRSHSPSKSRSRSCSLRSASRNRSRSSHRSRSLTGHERSNRNRQSSYSSCSGYTSSASSSSCFSGCSRSSCGRSRSSSCSSNSSCSTCSSVSPSRSRSRSLSRSRSRSSHHRSRSRQLSRERKLRPERSQDRCLSRSQSSAARSRHHRRSRHSRRSVSSCSTDSRYSCRSRSPLVPRPARDPSRERRREERRKQRELEKQKQMKERRIVYVGGIPRNYTRHQMRDNFSRFGEIENVQLHFREHGDNYGFVTFAYTCDAFAAIEKGKSIPGLKNFDLCFGGRRQFCDVEYADLDGNKEVEEEYDPGPRKPASLDFDELLRQARANINKS